MRRLTAGFVLGVGLGGFADGIALHQIAQWHNMGSAVVPPLSMEAMAWNMRWDGWFHAAMLVVTLTGVLWLHADGRAGVTPPRTVLLGQMLLGWGGFNLVEGLVDHHLLGLHHVRDLPVHVPVYDWLFLGLGGLLFIAIGLAMTRAAAPLTAPSGVPTSAATPPGRPVRRP